MLKETLYARSCGLKLIQEVKTEIGRTVLYRSNVFKKTFAIEFNDTENYCKIKAVSPDAKFEPIEFNYLDKEELWVEKLCKFEFATMKDALEFFAV